MKKMIMIIGSLRQKSFNKQLANYVEKILEGKVELSYLDYYQLPFIHLDDQQMELDVVTRVRQEILEADGIWIFSPVYNHEMPGLLKNVIDWLSCPLSASDRHGATPLTGKVITVSAAASSGQEEMFQQFLRLFPILRTEIVENFVHAPLRKENWISGELTLEEETMQALKQQAEAFLEALE